MDQNFPKVRVRVFLKGQEPSFLPALISKALLNQNNISQAISLIVFVPARTTELMQYPTMEFNF